MSKLVLSAAAAVAALLTSGTASAAIVLVPASAIQGDNVLFNTGTQTGTSLQGHTQTGVLVDFRGTTVGGGNVIQSNGGQARVYGADDLSTKNPNDTLLLKTLTFDLASGGTFDNLEFNLFGGNATTATIVLTSGAGIDTTFVQSLTNGQNFFGFVGTAGDSIRRASLSFGSNAGDGIDDVRQIRLDAMSAVPEPATWALMILGFGAVGGAMRRRRSVAASVRFA